MNILNYAYLLTVPAGIICIIIGIWVLLKREKNVPGYWTTAIEAIVFGVILLVSVPAIKWALNSVFSQTFMNAMGK